MKILPVVTVSMAAATVFLAGCGNAVTSHDHGLITPSYTPHAAATHVTTACTDIMVTIAKLGADLQNATPVQAMTVIGKLPAQITRDSHVTDGMTPALASNEGAFLRDTNSAIHAPDETSLKSALSLMRSDIKYITSVC